MSSDPILDRLRANLATPDATATRSYDPRKPNLRAVRKPVTDDIVNPATIVSAVANGAHDVIEIATYLGVNHSSYTLRSTLTQMVADGLLDADDNYSARRFALPWE